MLFLWGEKMKKIFLPIFLLENKKAERAITYLTISLFSIFVTVQILMIDADTRNAITSQEGTEGVFLEQSAIVSGKGYITLISDNPSDENSAWILANGQRIAKLKGNIVKITVSDNEVIEVDGTEAKKPFSVSIGECSDNIKLYTNGEAIDAQGRIAVVCRVVVKEVY